jgi:hypothetical protein
MSNVEHTAMLLNRIKTKSRTKNSHSRVVGATIPPSVAPGCKLPKETTRAPPSWKVVTF